LSNLNVKPLLHERKAPRTNVKPPIDDFLATVLDLPETKSQQGRNWRNELDSYVHM